MPLIAILTRDLDVRRAAAEVLSGDHALAGAVSWPRLCTVVRERPVSAVILDGAALPQLGYENALADLRRRFPSLSAVLLARPSTSPLALFRLGRAGVEDLVLLPFDDLGPGLTRAARKALGSSTSALVTRATSPYLPAREMRAIRLAMEGPQRGWGAEQLADARGLTRAHLSVRLRAAGLPSTGHLLVWAKLLHAARWLGDPGRSAESVSRQLEYSSGAAFRRALRNYVGVTPTGVREGGGLKLVLGRFMDECGLTPRRKVDRSVA